MFNQTIKLKVRGHFFPMKPVLENPSLSTDFWYGLYFFLNLAFTKVVCLKLSHIKTHQPTVYFCVFFLKFSVTLRNNNSKPPQPR